MRTHAHLIARPIHPHTSPPTLFTTVETLNDFYEGCKSLKLSTTNFSSHLIYSYFTIHFRLHRHEAGPLFDETQSRDRDHRVEEWHAGND